MSVRFRVFASGRLKGNNELLYRVPTGKSALINAMRFTYGPYNPGAAYFTITLQRGTTTTIIFPDGQDGPLGQFKMAVEDREITLAAGEEIRANLGATQSPDTIDYIICGVERDT